MAIGAESKGAKRRPPSSSETAIAKRSAEAAASEQAGGQISPRGLVHPLLNWFLNLFLPYLMRCHLSLAYLYLIAYQYRVATQVVTPGISLGDMGASL